MDVALSEGERFQRGVLNVANDFVLMLTRTELSVTRRKAMLSQRKQQWNFGAFIFFLLGKMKPSRFIIE